MINHECTTSLILAKILIFFVLSLERKEKLIKKNKNRENYRFVYFSTTKLIFCVNEFCSTKRI